MCAYQFPVSVGISLYIGTFVQNHQAPVKKYNQVNARIFHHKLTQQRLKSTENSLKIGALLHSKGRILPRATGVRYYLSPPPILPCSN